MYQVYCLTSPEGRKYIGSSSIELEKRWQNGNNYKYNDELFADIVKFGWVNFTKEVIATAETDEEITKLESEAIKKQWNDNPHKLYNISKKCYPKSVKNKSIETRQKMSKSRIIDIKNQRFGKLVAKEFVETRKGHAYWLFECDCGNQKVIMYQSVKSQKTVGCGKCKNKIFDE